MPLAALRQYNQSLAPSPKARENLVGPETEYVRSQTVVPPVAGNTSEGTDGMNYVTTRKTFSADEHRARIAAALRRRLYPNTALHAKQLAHAIGVTPDTISKWRRAYCDPGSFEIAKLFHYFFAVEGGPGFWVDIFGEPGHEQSRRIQYR